MERLRGLSPPPLFFHLSRWILCAGSWQGYRIVVAATWWFVIISKAEDMCSCWLCAFSAATQIKTAQTVAWLMPGTVCVTVTGCPELLCMPGLRRLLEAYNARIADEGEYDEQELPASMVDELEEAAGPARQAFAVRLPTQNTLVDFTVTRFEANATVPRAVSTFVLAVVLPLGLCDVDAVDDQVVMRVCLGLCVYVCAGVPSPHCACTRAVLALLLPAWRSTPVALSHTQASCRFSACMSALWGRTAV
jgi:hypothetical protein